MDKDEIYCPVCGRVITASNIEDVRNGTHDGYVYIHDNIPHEISDIKTYAELANV